MRQYCRRLQRERPTPSSWQVRRKAEEKLPPKARPSPWRRVLAPLWKRIQPWLAAGNSNPPLDPPVAEIDTTPRGRHPDWWSSGQETNLNGDTESSGASGEDEEDDAEASTRAVCADNIFLSERELSRLYGDDAEASIRAVCGDRLSERKPPCWRKNRGGPKKSVRFA
jgi:hypothetical protein